MNVTIKVFGRKMTFNENELTSILEKHFSEDSIAKEYEAAQKPFEGRFFDVNPKSIDQTVFKNRRKDHKQEKVRRLILEALLEMERDPEKYSEAFMSFIHEKTWNDTKTVSELEEFCSNLGGHMADWVEQALEWAQRISNGEEWADICNKPDTANWFRLVKWKRGFARIIGGCMKNGINKPATYVMGYNCNYETSIGNAVPLIIFQK